MFSHKQCQELIIKGQSIIQIFNNRNLTQKKQELELQLQQPEIWKDQLKANQINKELAIIKHKLGIVSVLENACNDLAVALELNLANAEVLEMYNTLNTNIEKAEEISFLTGKFDQKGAILTIHAGAGGIDAQDWASMLLAMYQTFANNQTFESKLIHLSLGEEGGTKSATLDITGNNVYGLLKEEAGVHRLVRISPFNSGQTRETSFSLVEVIPSGLDEEMKISNLDEKDLHWEYSMSSGKGGQSVNTTYSAVRLVHLPTGIAISCQNERSQVQNKQMAIKYLLNKLAILEARKQAELKKELRGEFHSIQWGNQIRSYTLHPYKLIKDHRSGYETTDTDSVLINGQILDFIWAHKKYSQELN